MDFFAGKEPSLLNPRQLAWQAPFPSVLLLPFLQAGSGAHKAALTAPMLASGIVLGCEIRPPHSTLSLQEIHVSKGSLILAMCPMGAPSAAFALELLRVGGVQRILFFGFCGAIADRVELGSLILPIKAFREEGTSYHYAEADVPAEPCPLLLQETKTRLQESGTPFRSGPIWTTDAPFRETPMKIQRHKAAGALAVEMELSALFIVGRYRNLSVCALLSVTDTLTHDRWSGFQVMEGWKGWMKLCRSDVLGILAA